MLQYGYLIWGTIVCLGLATADALGWQTPSLGASSGSRGSSGYFGGPSRGWGGTSGWGGGK